MKAAFGRVSITPPINDTFPDLFFDPEGILDEIHSRGGFGTNCFGGT